MEKSSVKRTIKIENIIDKDTGELLNEKFTTISYDREPDYIKLYLYDISKLYNLTVTQNKVFFSLLRKMNYDCEIVLTKNIRKELIENLNIPDISFKIGLSDLINKSIIMRIGNNHFLANTNIIARGNWCDIKKITTTIIYDKNGKMVYSKFDTQTEMEFTDNKNTK